MKNKVISFLLAVLSSILFYACQEDVPEDSGNNLVSQQLDTIEQYLAENKITAVEDEKGFYYRAMTENPDGEALETGDVVHLYYKLSTLNGQLIDEKKAGVDAPVIGAYGGELIKVPVALDVMLSMMKEGEAFEFYLPSSAAYQSFSKSGLIPEDAIITMQLELAEVLSPAEEKLVEDQKIKAYIAQEGLGMADSLTSGVYYIQTQAGEGVEVTNGKTASVRYEGTLLDGTVFDKNTDAGDAPFTVTIGTTNVIEGFETGLKQMQAGEKGIILIPSHAAYGEGSLIIPYTIMDDLLDKGYLPNAYGTFRKITPLSILRFNIEIESVN